MSWRPRIESPYARLGLPAVLALAALVRFAGLGARSLWTDEGSTWTAATLPWPALVRRCLERDASPPLYYLLTSWTLRLADREAGLRLVSALASLALVWLTYRLARLALDRPAAAFAALLAALSPFQVQYAQEARTYALVAAFSVWSTWLFARALGARERSWRPYVAATALGLWTQSLAVLGLASQGVLAVATAKGRRRLGRWLTATAVALALYAPWAWWSRGMAGHLSRSHWYVPDADAAGVLKVLRAVFVSSLPIVTAPPGSHLPGLDALLPRAFAWALLGLLPALPLLATLPLLAGRGPRATLAKVAWAGWLVPVLAVLVVSVRSPLFLARYFVFLGPFVATLLTLGLAELPVVPRRVLGGLLLAFTLLGLARYELDYTKEPWRAVAADLRARARPGRTAVLVPFDLDPLAFYLRDGRSGVRAFEVSHPAEPFASAYTPRELAELSAAARADAAPYDEVWVVVRSPNSPVRREVVRRAEAAAAAGGRVRTEQRTWDSFGGPLRVGRWQRAAADTLRAPRPAAAPADTVARAAPARPPRPHLRRRSRRPRHGGAAPPPLRSPGS